MTSKPTIVLKNVSVVGSKIDYSLSFDAELDPYLNGNNLQVKYETYLDNVPPGILSIPFVSSLLPVAWIRGADIRLTCLDRKFKRALEKIQEIYKRWYPQLPFRTELLVDKEETTIFRVRKQAFCILAVWIRLVLFWTTETNLRF